MPKSVGIYLYDGVEPLDFAGHYNAFTAAERLFQKQQAAPLFDTFTVGAINEPVAIRGGLKVIPDRTFASTPPIDLLLVPGGVHMEEMGKSEVIDWIAGAGGQADIVASVCTGVFLLAAAGLVDDLTVTTHWEDIEDLRAQFPRLNVVEDQRWVEQGKFITSAGVSAGTDMTLYLIERLTSPEFARRVARQLDYNWTRS